MKKMSTQQLVACAMLVAVNVVLNEWFALKTEVLKINFGFVALVLAGILYGPFASTTIAVLGDGLGLILFPPIGAPHLGFTVITGLVGLTYGVCLYSPKEPLQGKKMIFRSCLAAFLVTGVLYTGLNSALLGVVYGQNYIVGAMPVRILKNTVLCCMQCVMIPSMFVVRDRLAKQNLIQQ